MALDAMKNAYKAEVQARTMGPPHWQDGLCACTQDWNICCQTIWCPVCTLSNMVNKRDYGIAAFDCLNCFCITLGVYYMNRVPAYLAVSFRRELVQRYGIREESGCSSCVIGECCFPCVFCQVQREMGMRKEHVGGCCAKPPAEQPSMADKALAIAGNVLLNGPHAPRTWGSGLCDCTCMECVESIFCPCMIFGYMGGRLDSERVMGKQAGVMDCASCCGWMMAPDSWTYANRREIIERYNIFGESHIMSAFKILCCPFCSILQTRREMGYSGEWPGGVCQKEAPPRK